MGLRIAKPENPDDDPNNRGRWKQWTALTVSVLAIIDLVVLAIVSAYAVVRLWLS